MYQATEREGKQHSTKPRIKTRDDRVQVGLTGTNTNGGHNADYAIEACRIAEEVKQYGTNQPVFSALLTFIAKKINYYFPDKVG